MLSFTVPLHVRKNSCQAARISAHVRIRPPTYTWARTFSASLPSYHLAVTVLRTLLPNRIVETRQQIVDLSGLTRKFVKVPFYHPRWPTPFQGIRISNSIFDEQITRFPGDTRGFFYYRPGVPALAGGVRFRLSDNAAAFNAGRDLMFRGKPWEAQLVDITRCDVYRSFIPVLLAEGLVDEDLLLDARKSQDAWNTRQRFYSFSDPFILPLQQKVFTCGFYTRKGCHGHRFPGLCTKDNRRTKFLHPYTGSILAKFEISKLPEHAKFGPCLIVKCLEIVEPIGCIVPIYDGYVRQPTPGAYMRSGEKVWRFPLMRHLDTFRDMMEQEGLLPTD